MSNWVVVRFFLAIGVGVAAKYGRTEECSCGYGGLCLVKENIGNDVKFPCSEQLCTNISGGYYEYCDDIIDNCRHVTCKHGGECVQTWGSYFCRCPQHYFGQTCDIYNPSYTALSISNEVYVYNQIQPDRDGAHTFHIIYNLQNEWEDVRYDIGQYRYVGSYVNVNVTISDGRQFSPTKEGNFRLLDAKSKCRNEAAGNEGLYDSRICDFLPEGEVWTYSLETTFYQGHLNMDTAQYIDVEPIGRIGVAGTLQLKIEVVGENSSTSQVLFDNSYRIFSYTKFRIPHNCPVEMLLYGCSRSPSSPTRYSRGEMIRIGVSSSMHCRGVMSVGQKWAVYRNVRRLGGHVTQIAAKFDSSSPNSIVRGRFIQIPERYFEPGLHMVIYERIYRGKPPHYGSPREFSTFGRCWLNVSVKKPWFIVVGGNKRTVSCISNPLHVDINLGETNLLHKGVPTVLTWPRDYEIDEFEFIRQCNYSDDPDCKDMRLSSNTFIKTIVPCDKNYRYKIMARHRSGFVKSTTFETVMRFRKTDSDFIIYCWFNCFPIDPNFLTIVAINRFPYLAHKFNWTVSRKKEFLIPPDSNFSIFENSTATGIMRVHVLRLNFTANKKNSLAEKVTFNAERATNSPAGASLTTRMVNLNKYASLFELLPINNSDHLFKFAPTRMLPKDLVQESEPIHYRVFSRSGDVPWGDVVEVFATNWKEIVFRPFFPFVRLCMRDSNFIVACTAESEVNDDETQGRDMNHRRLKMWYRSGNNNFLLSGIVIYLSNSYRSGSLNLQDWRQLLFYIKKIRNARPNDISEALGVLDNYFTLMMVEETGNLECEDIVLIRDLLQLACEAVKTVDRLAESARGVTETAYLSNFPFKPQRTPSGDIVKKFLRTVVIIYSVDIYSIYHLSQHCNVEARLSVSMEARLKAEITYWVSYYYRSSHVLKILRLLLYETASFDFVRSEGTSYARVYMVSSTYFGILESFKKPKNRQNDGTEYIFRPPNDDYNGSEWLRHMDLSLPDITVNRTALFQMVVFTFKKDPAGGTINDNSSPFVLVHLTQGEKRVGFVPFTPEMPYNCTMPIKPYSGLHERQMVAESIVQPPFPLDLSTREDSPWRCMLVFQVKTNEIHAEQLWVHVVQFGYLPPWKLKGLVSFIIPDYDDISAADSLRGNLRSTPTALGKSKMKVNPPENSVFVPTVFYIGFLLDETVDPGVYWIGLYNRVPVCMVKALTDISRQHDTYCTTLEKVNGTIQCKCREFGIIYGRYDSLKITRLLIEPISLIWRVSRAAGFVDAIVVVGLSAVGLIIYAVSAIRDTRRKRQEILLPVIDVDPSVKNAKPYYIILGVKTGKNPLSCTISNVAIKVFGNLSSSKVHVLKTRRSGNFRWHGDDWFVIPEKVPLGEISHISVWIDFRLCSEWNCSRMWMMTTDTHKSYFFEVDRWFKLYPTDDESKMAQLMPVSKQSEEKSEDEFHRSKQTFIDYYATELHNTHLPSSIISLPLRSVESYKGRALMYIFKVSSMHFVASVIQRSALQKFFPEFYRRNEFSAVISLSSLVVALCIGTFSHIITYPAQVVNQLYVGSAMLQRRVTRNLMRSSRQHMKGKLAEDSGPVHLARSSRDSRFRRFSSATYRKLFSRSESPMSPKSLSKSEQREWRKLSRSPNKLTTSSSEGQHSQPSVRSAERDKSHAQEPSATISPVGKEGPKRMSFEHEQAKSPLASYFVGPSQFWVVNIPRHDVLARFCRYSVKSKSMGI